DTLSLSDAGFQREVLDALANNSVVLQQYQSIFRSWKSSQEELMQMQAQKASFDKEYDYNKFLYEELGQAAFAEDELEDADNELKMLTHAGDIKAGLTQATEALSGGDQPLVQQIKSIQHQLDAFAKYHNGVEDLVRRLHSAQIELQDIADEVESLNDNVSHNPPRIEQLNDRTALGYRLLKKHGVQTTAELLSLQKGFQEKLQAVMDIDEHIARKEKETGRLLKQLDESAAELSRKRNEQILPLQEKINKLLVQVGMPNARLKVSMENKAADLYGKDAVEFLFDANKSNRFETIRKVASGGELSRLMLSIKSLVAESMDLPTLIFDEIDTGISGEAAKQVGVIMSRLARKRQLITITHQPQIAGKANAHLFVYKDIKNNAIRTNIRQLSGEERIMAIAKMLSGEKPTAAALENAREMVMN
ncbi:MAG: DNA repair protein RecN, partial [Chitinophagaceae bacterium]|nr:DNA repair protein RecN [Chitinophagaceae bacterium]